MEPIYSFRVSVHPNQRQENKIVALDLQCFIFVTRIHIKVINVKLTRPFEPRLENICLYVSIQVRLKGGLAVIKLFSCSTQLTMKFILLIKVEMPTS